MRSAALLLLPGPVDPPGWWNDVPVAWPDVLRPAPTVSRAPYAVGWIAAVAAEVRTSLMTGQVVLVGHGSAGPLLPALAQALRAAGRRIGGYVFVDATLPRPGVVSHLDLLRSAAPDRAASRHDALHGNDAGRHDLWTERLPTVADWPDAPCAFVWTAGSGPATGPVDFWARSARSRGWPVSQGAEPSELLPTAVGTLSG